MRDFSGTKQSLATAQQSSENQLGDSDDEQWGAGKLVIDLEACQESAGAANHRPPETSVEFSPVNLEPAPATETLNAPAGVAAVTDRGTKVKAKRKTPRNSALQSEGGPCKNDFGGGLPTAAPTAPKKERTAAKNPSRTLGSDKLDKPAKGRKRKDKTSAGIDESKPASASSAMELSVAAGNSAAADRNPSPANALVATLLDDTIASRSKRAKADSATLTQPGEDGKSCCDASTDTADAHSVAVTTEPDCLGPCEPGTHVNLDGIVWQETANGVLVVNVTWRGKTYVGTLLDATKHDWAPPRLQCDSPTSDLESRGSKGRGKRRPLTATAAGANTSCFQDINERKLRQQGRRSSLQPPPPSPARSEVSVGGCKRKSGRSATSVSEGTSGDSVHDATADAACAPLPKRGRTSSRSSTNGGMAIAPTLQQAAAAAVGTASAPAAASVILLPAQYIECPEPNCSKKYRHINGLRYHQTHAHLDSATMAASSDEAATPPQSLAASCTPSPPPSAKDSLAVGSPSVATSPAKDMKASSSTVPDSSSQSISPAAVVPKRRFGGTDSGPKGSLVVATSANSAHVEQLEPTDLSTTRRAAADSAKVKSELVAPKLEPIDFELPLSLGYAESRFNVVTATLSNVPQRTAPSQAGVSLPTCSSSQDTVPADAASLLAVQSSGVTASDDSTLSQPPSLPFALCGASSVPVATIQPQVVKPLTAADQKSPIGVKSKIIAAASVLLPTSSRHLVPAPPKLLPRGPARVVAAVTPPLSSSASAIHPVLTTSTSLKPIQPKPTILGDLRPAVPASLSDLREPKRRDHRLEKGPKKLRDTTVKVERRSPTPPATGNAVGDVAKSGPVGDLDLVEGKQTSIARLRVLSPVPGSSRRETSARLQPTRPAIGGSESQKSPTAYSDISDDSSPERIAAAAATSAATSSEEQRKDSAACVTAKELQAVFTATDRTASYAPHYFGVQSSYPVAAVSPRKVVSERERCDEEAASLAIDRCSGLSAVTKERSSVTPPHQSAPRRLSSAEEQRMADHGLTAASLEKLQQQEAQHRQLQQQQEIQHRQLQQHCFPFWTPPFNYTDAFSMDWAAKNFECYSNAQSKVVVDAKFGSRHASGTPLRGSRDEQSKQLSMAVPDFRDKHAENFQVLKESIELKGQLPSLQSGNREITSSRGAVRPSQLEGGTLSRFDQRKNDDAGSSRRTQHQEQGNMRSGVVHSPSAAAPKSSPIECKSDDRLVASAAGDLPRLSSRLSASPNQYGTFLGYPFLPAVPGFGAAAFDQKSEAAAVAAAAALRGQPIPAMPLYPPFFMDPTRMAGEQRDLSGNMPSSSPFGGKGQLHKIHELEEPPSRAPTKSGKSVQAQDSGGGRDVPSSPSRGSPSHHSVAGCSPYVNVAAAAALYGSYSPAQGMPSFLQKP